MLLLFVRINNLVLEHQTICRAAARTPDDEELAMMQIEICSECTTIEADLLDPDAWASKHIGKNCLGAWSSSSSPDHTTERTRVGQDIYRTMIRTMILVDVFKVPPGHARLAKLVESFLQAVQQCPQGMEIGLVWPYIVSV